MSNFQTKLALKRLATNITSGLDTETLRRLLDVVLETGHVWDMAHDFASVKALLTLPELSRGQTRMAALLVNEELDTLTNKSWERVCLGTPLTQYRSRTFRSGKYRAFIRPDGTYYVDRRIE